MVVILKSLVPGCFFNIIGFGSTFKSLFTTSQNYEEVQQLWNTVMQLCCENVSKTIIRCCISRNKLSFFPLYLRKPWLWPVIMFGRSEPTWGGPTSWHRSVGSWGSRCSADTPASSSCSLMEPPATQAKSSSWFAAMHATSGKYSC